MAITNDEVISTLNDLIETCKDGQNGFQAAIEGVRDSALKTTFQKYVQQRAQFASELQNEVRRLGGDPEKSGSVSAALHRGWMDIKAAVTGKNDHAIVAECERGEDAAVKNYQEAINKNLPSQIASIVQRQYDAVKQAHDQIRRLRDTPRTATA